MDGNRERYRDIAHAPHCIQGSKATLRSPECDEKTGIEWKYAVPEQQNTAVQDQVTGLQEQRTFQAGRNIPLGATEYKFLSKSFKRIIEFSLLVMLYSLVILLFFFLLPHTAASRIARGKAMWRFISLRFTFLPR